MTVINNGLAPPNPTNVIDAADGFDIVSVQNEGCDTIGSGLPCPLPWGNPTVVELVDGGGLYFLVASQSSAITVRGGGAVQLGAGGSSTLTMTGGTTQDVVAGGMASALLSGGVVTDQVHVSDSALVTISGGEAARVQVADLATVRIEGGTVHGEVIGFGTASVEMQGGSVAHILAYDDVTVSLRGGSVAGFLVAYQSSAMTIAGQEFAVDGIPVAPGTLPAQSGTLAGVLESGESFTSSFCHNGCETGAEDPEDAIATGVITLVPEPAGAAWFATLALGVLALGGRCLGRGDVR